jgi:phosphoribosylanthranilate isomerase
MNPHVRIKICGVTTPADALAAARLGADAIGLNFCPPSPRCIDDVAADAILHVLPPFVEAVGVFVNETMENMKDRALRLGRIQTVQIHAPQPESPLGFPFSVIVAQSVRDASSLAGLTAYLDWCRHQGQLPAAVLIDAHVPGLYGGTGQTAPWDLLQGFQPGVPLILAGGLTPENVADAIRRVRPYAVDVASGVESAPGRQDPEKIRRFIEAVHSAV